MLCTNSAKNKQLPAHGVSSENISHMHLNWIPETIDELIHKHWITALKQYYKHWIPGLKQQAYTQKFWHKSNATARTQKLQMYRHKCETRSYSPTILLCGCIHKRTKKSYVYTETEDREAGSRSNVQWSWEHIDRHVINFVKDFQNVGRRSESSGWSAEIKTIIETTGCWDTHVFVWE